jgi:BirA family biotin operon repressor/biotin-[acetyl-CoA-carboxylase] ligase
MQKAFALLEHLQDGNAHSGEEIARRLGVTRTAVWNHVKRLQAEGVAIHAISGKGYRIPGGYEFLSSDAIELALNPSSRQVISALHVERVTDSTNQRLLDLIGESEIHGVAWLAEYQTRGRGRRGGSWLAPPGSGLCLSLGWRFDTPPSSISALSLVVGIAVVRALRRLGGANLQLKWPNDVYHAERKLAGILIEMRSEFGGPCTVAIGIGLNVALSPDAHARIDEIATDASSACGFVPSRNTAAASILDELVSVLQDFSTAGFDAYRSEWKQHDYLADRRIRVEMPGRMVRGVARGVAEDGTLLVEHDGTTEAFLSGHIVMEGEH